MRRGEPGYVIARSFLLPWLSRYFRIHLEGLEEIPPQGPAIIAANHVSFFDPLAVAFAVHKRGRRPRFFAKAPLFEIPVFGWILRSARQIPVERGTAQAAASLDNALKAMKDGEVVVIFPEGTIPMDEDLRPLPPKTGMARLALKARAEIVPCATWGGQWIWGYHYGFKPKFRSESWVRLGTPIRLDEFRGREDDPAAWEEVGRMVMREVAVLRAGLESAKPWTRKPLARMGLRKKRKKEAASDAG